MAVVKERKPYKNRDADERQATLYKKFPSDSFLGNETSCDHMIEWVTFFRRNLHRFATDYLGIKLYLYQAITLFLMGINNFFVIVASRASAKSFMIALYACCKCILYPNSIIVLSSATKGQSKLLVSEKIQKELCNMSPQLRKEIDRVKDNQNEVIVYFKNHSSIVVVPALDTARGHRSTVIVREEFRQIKKSIEDGILSPFQIVRQTPFRKDDYYAGMKELIEEPTDIYISSSWFDNGHWMWGIVDKSYDEMLRGKPSCLLAFDESVALKHELKTLHYFQSEKKKQDQITFNLEFLNMRLKDNQFSFFTYEMIQQNQRCRQPFYPRNTLDYKANRKNPFDIPKQKGEIRVISCDMAFVENKKNDNSIFSMLRLLPDSTVYTSDNGEVVVDNGYRRIVPYIESIQGGDTKMQAVRIEQLFYDSGADFIVLDTRNCGLGIFDLLAKTLYDEERCVEYPPLTCMNDDGLANRIKIEGARPCIYAINATQKLNSDIAIDFRRILANKQIDFLVRFETAREEILPEIKEYSNSPDADVQFFYEAPYLETQEFISETTGLVYEKKPQTGVIVISEQGNNRKDRYTSVSYGSWFASALEKDLLAANEDYEFGVFIN